MTLRDRRKLSPVVWLPTLLALVPLAAQYQPSTPPHFSTVIIPTGGDPDALAVADVNEDGAPDILAANPNSGTITVLLGNGRGQFRPASRSPFPAGHLPNDIGIGDFDGDGHADLLIANHQAPYVTLLLGDGKGGFRAAPHSPFATKASPHPHGVTVGHFCGATQPLDAVIDSWGSSHVELLIGDGHGNLRNGPMFPAGPGSDVPLRSADFNGDAVPDVVMPDTAIGHWDSEQVSVLLGDGHCGFQPAPGSPFSAGAVPWSLTVADLDNNGVPDLIVLPYAPQVRDPRKVAATVLLGDGKGGFHPMPRSPFPLPGCSSPRRVAAGNVTGSRTKNFVVTCANSDSILLFSPDRTAGYHPNAVSVATGKPGQPVSERGIAVADLTGSGRCEIIVSNGTAGTITILFAQ